MWMMKSKIAGAAFLFAFVCFVFADCTKESSDSDLAAEGSPAMAVEATQDVEAEADNGVSAGEDGVQTEDSVSPEDETLSEGTAMDPPPSAAESASAKPQSVPEPAQQAPAPAQAPVQQKYSVVDPDGITYTGNEPMFIICKCGEKFTSGSAWQSHFGYYSAYRCSCGKNFTTIGGWESHAGIYDTNTFIYTGKTRAEASAEGHALANEGSYDSEYNSHSGWRTTGFPG